MDEVLPIDPYNSEFVEAFFLRRLKAVALRLCSGNLADAMDLLDDTAGWFYSWKPWTKGLPDEEWFPYSVTVMKRIHYRGSKDEPPMDEFDEEMEERVGSDDSSAVKDIQHVADKEVPGVKSYALIRRRPRDAGLYLLPVFLRHDACGGWQGNGLVASTGN